MKMFLKVFLAFLIVGIGSMHAQTKASTTVYSGSNMYESQLNASVTAFDAWFVPDNPMYDMVRTTDSTNLGAPLNLYLDKYFYVDHTNGIFHLDPTQIDFNDLKNKPNISVNRTFANPTRTLNSAFQIDASKDVLVSYAVDVAATLSLITGQFGTVVLEYADDSGITTNVVTVNQAANGNTGSLTLGLNLTQTATATVCGVIPAGKYVRIRTVNTVGTPAFTYRSGQEVKL